MAAPVITTAECRPLPTAQHEIFGHSRACVHLLDDMPAVVLLARGPVERLNFQPRIMCKPQPIIAARNGDVLTLSVDKIGKIADHQPRRGMNGDRRLTRHWYFDLSECPGNHNLVIAVQRTEAR